MSSIEGNFRAGKGCCWSIYSLNRTEQAHTVLVSPSGDLATAQSQNGPRITYRLGVYNWYNPYIIFLRIFCCCCPSLDSFKINDRIYYCFKSDVINAARQFAGTHGQIANREDSIYENNKGQKTLVEFVNDLVSTMSGHPAKDDGDFGTS